MVDIVGERTVSNGFVTKLGSAVIKYLFMKMTYTWLSGRMTVKPSDLNRSETLVYNQSLAAKPPTKMTFYLRVILDKYPKDGAFCSLRTSCDLSCAARVQSRRCI